MTVTLNEVESLRRRPAIIVDLQRHEKGVARLRGRRRPGDQPGLVVDGHAVGDRAQQPEPQEVRGQVRIGRRGLDSQGLAGRDALVGNGGQRGRAIGNRGEGVGDRDAVTRQADHQAVGRRSGQIPVAQGVFGARIQVRRKRLPHRRGASSAATAGHQMQALLARLHWVRHQGRGSVIGGDRPGAGQIQFEIAVGQEVRAGSSDAPGDELQVVQIDVPRPPAGTHREWRPIPPP